MSHLLSYIHSHAPETRDYRLIGTEQTGKRIRSMLYLIFEDEKNQHIKTYTAFGQEDERAKYHEKIIQKYVLPSMRNRTDDVNGFDMMMNYDDYLEKECSDPMQLAMAIETELAQDWSQGIPSEYQAILDSLPRYVNHRSYLRWWDKNKLTKTIVMNYGLVSPYTGKSPLSIDVIAQSASLSWSGDMREDMIGPNDVVDFMHDFPRKYKDVARVYGGWKIDRLKQRFWELTGYDYDKIKQYLWRREGVAKEIGVLDEEVPF